MTDVLSEIINRLPPSTLRLIAESGNGSSNRNSVNDLLRDFEQIKIRQTNRDLKRKITDIKLRTADNRKRLLMLRKELEVLKCSKKTTVNTDGASAYTEKINEFECKLGKLSKDHDGVDLIQLFKEVESLNTQVEEYRKKISEAKAKYQNYDGFPPDIAEGRKAIAAVKERIRHNKSVVNSLYQPSHVL